MRVSDPIERDEQMVMLREDEAIREQRWIDMADWLKSGRTPTLLRTIADLMEDRRDLYHIPVVVQQPLLDFVETEGWSGVLSCLARVMREVGQ